MGNKITVHSTLFCRDARGAVREWRMEILEANYRTVSGILSVESSVVVSEWTKVNGKNIGRTNETSPSEQAVKEVESRYTKQLKTGYFENQSDIDGISYVEPMLAKSYEDYRGKIDFTKGSWWLQVKYNGLRMVASRHGLFTRKGERYVSVPHITEALAPFFVKYPDAVLDGECFNEHYRQELNEIVKIARKTINVSKEDIQRSREIICFYVYDGYGFTQSLDENAPYNERKAWINHNVAYQYEFIQQVPDVQLASAEQMESEYAKYVAAGHEGGILRNALAPYEHKRSKNLLKLKPLEDDEFIITNIQEGTGNWSGKAKIISLRAKNGKEFDATFKGNMEDATAFLKVKDKWVGKEVSVQYNGFTGLGCPQFAQVDYKNLQKGDR